MLAHVRIVQMAKRRTLRLLESSITLNIFDKAQTETTNQHTDAKMSQQGSFQKKLK